MFLGIDLGTSAAKAVAVDDGGSVVARGSGPLRTSHPGDLRSEQDPVDWWTAVETAVNAIPRPVRAAVRGIGLAGQMHGATVLGDDDRPLRPAILWNDGRSFDECAELERMVPALPRIAGNRAMPGFTAPKLLWIRRHEPELFARIRTVLLPKDYVRLLLTGDRATDASDAAGTLWLDVGGRAWSDTLLAACGLTTVAMPAVFEGTAVTGRLRQDIAARWGMRPVPVAAGGGDNAAAAAGVGVVRDGAAVLSLGTSGTIFVATDTYRADPGHGVHAFCHCLPGLWHRMSVHLSAAACVDWIARIVGADGPAGAFALAAAVGPAAGPELFLPYLTGERTPHNDPHIRGTFLELNGDTDAGRLAQAVLEGVAFALADGLEVLQTAGTRVNALAVVGGGSRSHYWGRIIAATLGVPLSYLRNAEDGPALGAARLARIAVDGGSPDLVCTAPPVDRTLEPEADLAARLADKRAAFRAAYPRLASRRQGDSP